MRFFFSFLITLVLTSSSFAMAGYYCEDYALDHFNWCYEIRGLDINTCAQTANNAYSNCRNFDNPSPE